MRLHTKLFGEIEIDEQKKITFKEGIIGFPDLKEFFLMFDSEKETHNGISWLQSANDAAFALPVISPLIIDPDYNPVIEDKFIEGIESPPEEHLAVFVTLRVPNDITKMTVNMKAPIIINAEKHKGCQIIIENDKYSIRHEVYELLNRNKKAGE